MSDLKLSQDDPAPHQPRGQSGKPHEPAVEPGDYPFWPVHVMDQLVVAYLLVGLLLTLAIVVPTTMGGVADPLHAPGPVKPQWYFLPLYQLVRLVPTGVGVAVTGLFLLGLLLWPFAAAVLERRSGSQRLAGLLGSLVLGGVASLLLLGVVSRGVTVQPSAGDPAVAMPAEEAHP